MQLCLVFHKTVHQSKLKVWSFQKHKLSSFLAIRKTVAGVEGGKG